MDEINIGRLLSARLREQMCLKQHSLSTLAKQLEISQGYLSQLLSGDKCFTNVRDDLIRELAAYLELPVMVCFFLSGKIRAEDFVLPEAEAERSFSRALRFIFDSSYALEAGVEFRELEMTPRSIQRLIVLLYQSAAKAHIFPPCEEWHFMWRGKANK